MKKEFNVYKGLQRPLIYKGFKGKYIFWGLTFLIGGLALGAIVSSVINTYLGALMGIGGVVGGIVYTASQQKKGLHSKKRETKIFVPSLRFNRGMINVSRMKVKLLEHIENGKKETI